MSYVFAICFSYDKPRDPLLLARLGGQYIISPKDPPSPLKRTGGIGFTASRHLHVKLP
jgi:hypothetical protein